MIRLCDFMTRDVATIPPDASPREAMELFASRHITGAPVVERGAVVGVLSATDLVAFAAGTRVTPAPAGAPAATPEADEPDDWRARALRSVAAVDLAAAWAASADDEPEPPDAGPEWHVLEAHTVGELMTRGIVALPPDATALDAARMMARHAIHRLLVMERGRLVGIVTATDVVHVVAAHRLATRTYIFPARRGAP